MQFIDKVHELAGDIMNKDSFSEIILDLSSALLGDPVSAAKVMSQIYNSPLMIKEKIFWIKFEKFLEGVYSNHENIQKMSVVFADHNNDNKYSYRIIKTIEDINTINKTIYITNLTRACLQNFIDKNMYFRLCTLIVSTLEEDLDYIKINIGTEIFEEDINTISLMHNGLMFETKGGYAFTSIAHLLDVYSLSYGNENKYNFSNYKIPQIPKPLSHFQLYIDPSSSIETSEIILDEP